MGVLTTGLESGLFNVVTFDGGGTTGWSVVSYRTAAFTERGAILDHVAFWAAGQYIGPLEHQIHEAIQLCVAWAPQYPGSRAGDWAPLDNLAVVAEDFTLRQFRMDSTLLLPVEFNAGLRQGLWNMTPRRRLFKQQPAMAMGEMPDRRLELADVYASVTPGTKGGYFAATKGKPHARDALRHNFTFARREASARREGRSLIPLGGAQPGA